MKERRTTDKNIKDFYRFYKKNLNGTLSASEFGKVLRALYEAVSNNIILDGKVFYCPMGLGNISLIKRKGETKLDENFEIVSTTLPTDWVATWNLWKTDAEARERRDKIYMDNSHSNDWVYRFAWRRTTAITGLKIYAYKPTRRMQRSTAKRIKRTGEIKDVQIWQ